MSSVPVGWWDGAESFSHVNKTPQKRKCHGTSDPPTKKWDLTRSRHRFEPWPSGGSAFFTPPHNLKWCRNVDIFPTWQHEWLRQIKHGGHYHMQILLLAPFVHELPPAYKNHFQFCMNVLWWDLHITVPQQKEGHVSRFTRNSVRSSTQFWASGNSFHFYCTPYKIFLKGLYVMQNQLFGVLNVL